MSEIDVLKNDENSGSPEAAKSLQRRREWFVPGRIFLLHAPADGEIHLRHFILLDSKAYEGKAVSFELLNEASLQQLADKSKAAQVIIELKEFERSEAVRRPFIC